MGNLRFCIRFKLSDAIHLQQTLLKAHDGPSDGSLSDRERAQIRMFGFQLLARFVNEKPAITADRRKEQHSEIIEKRNRLGGD